MHGIGIHHPRHGLFVSVHIRSRDIFLRADEFHQFRGVAAGHAFELALRHFVRIANYAALGAAERNIHDCALPGHPTGKGADFIERDIGRVAHAAFGGATGNGVLYPESGEDFELAVVHGDRNVNDEFAVGILQDFPYAFIEVELLRGKVKARRLRFPGIDLLFQRYGFHRISDCTRRSREGQPSATLCVPTREA